MGVRGEAELGRAGQRATSCPSSAKSRLHPHQTPPPQMPTQSQGWKGE